MGLDKLSNWVIVFDLDDTLYSEADYRCSGLRAVCDFVRLCYGVFLDPVCFYEKEDALGDICRQANLEQNIKNSLLWVYRLHYPSIDLGEEVSLVVADFGRRFDLAILTDGRSVTQRLKVKALGLDWIPVYVSEDYNSEKPDLKRFLAIMEDFPDGRYVYIGDNPKKDFFGPNRLGWLTIGVKGGAGNVHDQSFVNPVLEYMPKHWVDSFSEIANILC